MEKVPAPTLTPVGNEGGCDGTTGNHSLHEEEEEALCWHWRRLYPYWHWVSGWLGWQTWLELEACVQRKAPPCARCHRPAISGFLGSVAFLAVELSKMRQAGALFLAPRALYASRHSVGSTSARV